eukprot:353485-Chlamydomonas_euryale.AAC.2
MQLHSAAGRRRIVALPAVAAFQPGAEPPAQPRVRGDEGEGGCMEVPRCSGSRAAAQLTATMSTTAKRNQRCRAGSHNLRWHLPACGRSTAPRLGQRGRRLPAHAGVHRSMGGRRRLEEGLLRAKEAPRW